MDYSYLLRWFYSSLLEMSRPTSQTLFGCCCDACAPYGDIESLVVVFSGTTLCSCLIASGISSYNFAGSANGALIVPRAFYSVWRNTSGPIVATRTAFHGLTCSGTPFGGANLQLGAEIFCGGSGEGPPGTFRVKGFLIDSQLGITEFFDGSSPTPFGTFTNTLTACVISGPSGPVFASGGTATLS